MKPQTFAHATLLSKSIEELTKHLESIRRLRKDNRRLSRQDDYIEDELMLKSRGNNYSHVAINSSLLVIPPNKLLNLYEAEIQADIARKQEELDYLTDDNCPKEY